MRLTNEELNKVCKKYGVDTLWSFSRFDCFRTSHYEFFLKYIKRIYPKAEDSPYASLGGAAHDILEKLYNDEIKYDDMVKEYEIEYSTIVDVMDLKFNRADEVKNKSISTKYYDNMIHFFNHYQKLNCKVLCEQFIPIKITDDIVFQGYIDAMFKNDDGDYVILDYKTSSLYRGKAIEEHSHQLVLYAEGIRQKGIPADKIKIAWNFLKYARVSQMMANGKWKDTICERREIGNKIATKLKMWGKKLGYVEEEMLNFTNEILVSCDLSILPDDLREKFKVGDAYVYIDNWQDIYKDLKEEIIQTVDEIRRLKDEYDETDNDHVFYDNEENIKSNLFYYTNLSDYTIQQLKPVAEYLKKQEEEKEAADDLLGVGKIVQDDEEDDFSWLDDL